MEAHRMQRIFKAVKIEPRALQLLAPAIYLFVLPLAHTTGLRSTAFGISVLLLALTWWSSPMPTIPLKASFAAWLTLALVTLIWAIDPEYSLGEIRTEIVYGFFTFLVFFKATRSERDLNLWFLTLIASALVVGTFALIHTLRGLNPYLVGMHGGTLYYAGYLNTIFPILAAIAILRPGWRRFAVI